MANKRHFVELDKSAMGKLCMFLRQLAMKENWRVRKRASAVYFSCQYRTVPKIAKELRCSESSVYKWLKRYQKYGLDGIATKKPPSKLTPQQASEIIKMSGWKTSHLNGKEFQKAWSFRKIALWIKDNWNITISHERVRQIIQEKMKP